MTSLTPSPVLVALLQTATSLPVFILGLPAGALADVIDRRRLLIATQSWMLATAVLLGILTLAGLITAGTLLALTFILGLGGALNGPAWQASVPDLVDKSELPSAVALNSAGFNLARAVGPALGGIVVALMGPGAVFVLNAASFLGVLVVLYRWKRTRPESTAPPEDIFGAIAAGARYTRHAPQLQAVLVRAAVFIIAASGLWALLPVVARTNLGLDATGYGVLLGSLGLGAVGGAVILPHLRRGMSVDRLAIVSTLVFALATLALAYVNNMILLVAAMLAGGLAWMAIMSSLNVSAQTASPACAGSCQGARHLPSGVPGRHGPGQFCMGRSGRPRGHTRGAACGLNRARGGAGCGFAVALASQSTNSISARRSIGPNPGWHWNRGLMTAQCWSRSSTRLVRIKLMLSWRPCRMLERLRRRDGATRWGLFRNSADPDHYIETFLVPSWAEHLRQHTRTTVADQMMQQSSLTLQKPGTEPVINHFIAAEPSEEAPQRLVAPMKTAVAE